MTKAEAEAFVSSLVQTYRRGYPAQTICRWVLEDLENYPEFTRNWIVKINWEPYDDSFLPGANSRELFIVTERPVIDMLAEVYRADARVA